MVVASSKSMCYTCNISGKLSFNLQFNYKETIQTQGKFISRKCDSLDSNSWLVTATSSYLELFWAKKNYIIMRKRDNLQLIKGNI